MKAFVANCTMQNHVFTYRLPERKGSNMQPIAPGRQIQVSGDLNVKQLETLIEQHRKYGLRTAEEARVLDRNMAVTYIVSVDKPITDKMIRDALAHNRGIRTQEGKNMRELAAIAASTNMAEQAHTPNAASTLELSLEEQPTGGQDPNAPGLTTEGYRLGDTPLDGSKAPTGRRGRR